MSRRLKGFLLFVLSVPLMANTGIPMVAMTLPLMVLLFVPVVLIESVIVKRLLNLKWSKALGTMFSANLWTTVLGLPLSNLISLFVAFVARFAVPNSAFASHRTLLKATLGSYWFDDHYFTFTGTGELIRPLASEPGWYFAVAVAFAFLVNLLVSIYLEYWVMRRRIESPVPSLRRASIVANSASYVFLLIATILIALFRKTNPY